MSYHISHYVQENQMQMQGSQGVPSVLHRSFLPSFEVNEFRLLSRRHLRSAWPIKATRCYLAS